MKKKKKTNWPIILILILMLLSLGYLGASYWIPPNTPTNIVGRYEFFVDTETCEVEVYDHVTEKDYVWPTSQVRDAITSGQGIIVSGSEAGIRNCLGNDIWNQYLTTTSTTTTIPPIECQSDSDCFWCGDVCRKWEEDLACIMITPPDDKDCKCVSNKCQAVPKEEFPITALLLLGGLGIIIIKGKKWLK